MYRSVDVEQNIFNLKYVFLLKGLRFTFDIA